MNNSTDHKNEMGIKPVGKLLFEYSIPAIFAMCIIAFNHVISSIFIGYGVGHLALASMAVTFPVINLIIAFCQLIAVGSATLCSIELGRKNMEKAESMLGHVFILEVGCGLVFGLVTWLFLESILLFFGASKDTLQYAYDFMLPQIIVAPISFLFIGLNFLTRATGYPKTSMMTAIFTSIAIIVLSPLFIYEFNWGMAGAAWAQAAGQTISCVWLLAHFMRKKSLIHFSRTIWKLNIESIKKILSIGMAPFLINACACVVVIVINNSLLKYGGDLAVGAYGILNRLLMLFGMAVVGLGQGMQPIIGYNFGAGNKERVRTTLKYGLYVGVSITFSGMIGALFFPEFLVGFFTEHPEMVKVSSHALCLAGSLFIFVGPQILTGLYFQSIGQAKIASFVSLFRQVIYLIPALFILPLFFGLDGVWLSMPLADLLGCITALFILRYSIKAEDNTCKKEDLECEPPIEFFRPKKF